MSRVFIDTSAILALLIASDKAHHAAAVAFERLCAWEAALVTSSYILVETYALLGRRVGMDAVKEFRDDFAPLLDIVWIDSQLQEKALDLWMRRSSRALSLVDAASFVVMRNERIDDAFTYDRHFTQEGFRVV